MTDSHCVYVLKNTVTGKCYVGCTKTLKARIQGHKQQMRSGKHSVEQIIEDYKKYGEESFTCTVVGKYDKPKALQMEAFYSAVLRSKDRQYGYNYKDKKGTGILYVVDKWRTVGYDHSGKRLYHYVKHGKLLAPEYTAKHA